MSDIALAAVAAIAGARKALQLYPPTHPRHREALEALVGAIRACAASGPFSLNIHEGGLYAGSHILADDAPGVCALAEAFEARRLVSLTFQPGFTETDAVAVAEVLSLRPDLEPDLDAALLARGATNVAVTELADPDDDREDRDRKRREDRALYHQLVGVMRRVSARIQQGGEPDIVQAGGMVESILGRLMEDEAAVLGMATLRASSEQSLFHSINVMIYALTLGAQLGLPQEGLESLGLSALLHDIGKAMYDVSDPEQAEAARAMHPVVGAEILARMPGDDRAPMLVAYEHHMGVDGSGFPERDDLYVPHPFSRMVAIADRYEMLTKPDASGNSRTPDKAVVRLLQESKALDPVFTRLFVRALGVFPIGCMVRLSDLSVGVVCRKGTDLLTPVVRIVYGPDGLQAAEPVDVDLAESELTIVEVVEPESLDAAVADHL
ncbi:MAG: HD domain-containing phosphohydrolase [Coriobacteriia bacterium]